MSLCSGVKLPVSCPSIISVTSSCLVGIKNDYYVAMSITYQNVFEFPNKKFYYAMSNEFYFKEMPDLND